jgi:iron(III) transport system ATP-binding protein
MTSTPAALQLENIGVMLGGRPIVQAVSLTLERGQVLALLGPSGCGKTTLLRSIAGLNTTSTGNMLLAGRDCTHDRVQARGIGMVFQHYALFPNMSVLDNVMFGPQTHGVAASSARERAEHLLDLVNLRAHAGKRPAQLSGGQRQRVALARALASEPAVLLMDEPFSALDESFRLPLRRAFRELQRKLGQSCVIVTHDREEAFEIADQVAVMFEGRIVQVAPPRTLWRAPANRQVAEFLGAHNLLEAAHMAEPWTRPHGVWLFPREGVQVLPAHEVVAVGGADLAMSTTGPIRFGGRVLSRYDTLRTEVLEVQLDDGQVVELQVPLQAGQGIDAFVASADDHVVCTVARERLHFLEA